MRWDSIRTIRTRLLHEQGGVVKDWGGKLPVALVYPNSYYLGMSNLGIQTIYRLLNNYPDIVGERCFYDPKYPDIPLAMESQRPLTDFSVLAFSVSYELDYFNIPRILHLSGLPIYSRERDETHPLIIAGGPCITGNGAPLAPFFDCLCIGEAEKILPSLLTVLRTGAGEKRSHLLGQLANLPGIYVPQYSAQPAQRQWVKNPEDFPTHSAVLTRDTELGDMYLIEVGRGCGWGCKFCLVSNCFKPMRFHPAASLVKQAEEGLLYRKKLGLLGPAVTDHPEIEEIVSRIAAMGAQLSVSSLRIKPLVKSVLGDMIESGARTVTLAPEAGSQKLRDAIGKRIHEKDILAAVAQVALQGIKQLKLYFMFGLPGETDADINEIIELVQKCRETLGKKLTGGRINITLSAFIPKATTVFQYEGMASLEILNYRLAHLRSKLSRQGISVKCESLEWAEVQAVLSRGDSSLAPVIAGMEKVSLAQWQKNTVKYDTSIHSIAHRRWEQTEKMPWENFVRS